jgi:hypothetical protein
MFNVTQTNEEFLIPHLEEIKSLVAALHLVHTHEELTHYPELNPPFEVMQAIFLKIDTLIIGIQERRERVEEEMKKFEQGFAYKPKKKDG